MAFPKPTEEDKEYFAELVASVPGATVKPMFGNAGGFLPDNGQMFLSLFGEAISVRLDDTQRAELLEHPGTSVLEPMPGRPMKEYVSLPSAWRDEPAQLHAWIDRSVAWVATLPPKKK